MIERMLLPLLMRDATLIDGRELGDARAAMNEEEFRAFYDRTSGPLWAYLSRLTRDRHQADDALQETYYRFYRAGSEYESDMHRRKSLYTIATNIVRDAARRRKGREEVALEQDSPASPSLAPERQVMIRTDLKRAMERLDPTQREMLWLAYAHGASHEEIASILGLRTISIRALLLRARRKLAAILTEKTR